MRLFFVLLFVNILNINSQTYLTTTLFSNGEPISEAKTKAEWEQLSMNNQPVLMKKNIEGKEYFFYNWYAISDVRGIVIEKWMIPNQNEMVIWNAYSPIEITPIGIVSEQGAFSKVTEQNYFWTSSEYMDKGKRESAVSVSISKTNIGETEIKQAYKQEGFLVWIVEKEKMSIAIKEAAKLMLDAKKSSSTIVNNTTKTETNSTTVNSTTTKDYKTVKIGNQIWMTENLNVDRFRNGDLIPEAKTADEWELAGKNKQPAWCYYENDPKNAEKYGKLYNWYAVNDPRGLAPKGWHVPSDTEWTQLTNYLGGMYAAGEKMKSIIGWNKNGNGTNSSGFSALPGGYRTFNGLFFSIGDFGFWWSSSEDGTTNVWTRDLNYDGGDVNRFNYDKEKGLSVSVRCLSD